MRCKNSLLKKMPCIGLIVLVLTVLCSSVCLSDPVNDTVNPLGQSNGTELIAAAGGPYTGNVSEYILFEGKESSGDIVTYKWDFGDGTTGIGIIIYHMYSSAGTYTVTLTVTNSTGVTSNQITTVTITEPPIVEPSITISNIKYPSRVTSEDPITIYAAIIGEDPIFSVTLRWYDGIDNYDKEMTANGDIYSTDIGPFTDGKTVEFEIEAIDIKNEKAYHTGRFEVAEPTATEEITSIIKGENREVLIKNTNIRKINLKPKEDLQNVKITIENLTPEEIKEKIYLGEGQVYWYFNLMISADNVYVSEDKIESSTIEFKVEKSWAHKVRTDEEGKRYNLSNINLYRYKNNIWDELTTNITAEVNETYIIFRVEVPGYSTFAVVGSKVVEKEQTFPVETEIPWIIIIGSVIAAIVILLIFLIKARYIYLEEEGQEKNK